MTAAFVVSDDDLISEVLEAAHPQVQKLYSELASERRLKSARSMVRQEEVRDLRAEETQLSFIVEDLERQMRRDGSAMNREVDRGHDKHGKPIIETIPDKTLDRHRKRLAKVQARIRELSDESAARYFDALSFVHTHIVEQPRSTILEAETLPQVSEFDGDPDEMFKENFKLSNDKFKTVEALYNKPRSKDEMKASVAAELKATAARGVVDVGGHSRTFGTDFHGNRIVDVPDAKLRWPTVVRDSVEGLTRVETVDTAAMFARLYHDQILADLFKQIDGMDDSGAMSVEARRAAIAQAESELWSQHVLTEAWFRCARDNGTKLFRTGPEGKYIGPWEVLIGAKKLRR